MACKPRAGEVTTFSGGKGDAENFRGLFQSQVPRVAELHKFGFLRVLDAKFVQGSPTASNSSSLGWQPG